MKKQEMMHDKLKNALEWRYATKKFDFESNITNEDLDAIINAIRMAPSSMGIQPFHIYVVGRGELREKLYEYSKQAQVRDADYLFVFAPKYDMSKSEISNFIEMEGKMRGHAAEQIQNRIDKVEKFVDDRRGDRLFDWSARQTYIALGFAIQAAAILGIDACPMEGFKAEEFDRILNTSELNVRALGLMALGKRSAEDPAQFKPKVRKCKEELFTLIS